MRYVKWGLAALVLLIVAGFLHYTLPQRDIVQIVGTDVKRMDVGNSWFWAAQDSNTAISGTRDVRFINARTPDGRQRVYRNEDTNWGWPPYFKFSSGDLSAQAQIHAKDDAWVAVTHYGWRFNPLSMFPNAVKMKVVEGPDARPLPWFNIVFFVVLAAFLWWILGVLRRFRARRIDPVLDDIDEGWDEVEARAADFWARLRGRLRR
jgi:hypothetical protein